MKKIFKVHSTECLFVDIPEDVSEKDFKGFVKAACYDSLFRVKEILFPEVTDIEDDKGNSLMETPVPLSLRKESSLLLYVPQYKTVLRLEDGAGLSGDFLTEEDCAEGYDSYINWDSEVFSDSDLDNMFTARDGGVFLYKSEEVKTWQDCIREAAADALDVSADDNFTVIVLGSGS